ncbi:hypothetical protein COO91_08972 [Nostoc flagelliforme CCNUN1]|uniref:Uncharacterized protein n=1 Tax=Nostoc flagelliforme CCNUN1 TaxID=2038116 RepID=A0A2K8T540_9NOSO|nr:hypothetical protein COO91_08972 [Nostoc flagelliforme CCNUN1]
MQLLISKCSQANGKWTDQFTRNWAWSIGHWALGIGYSSCLPHFPLLSLPFHSPLPTLPI